MMDILREWIFWGMLSPFIVITIGLALTAACCLGEALRSWWQS